MIRLELLTGQLLTVGIEVQHMGVEILEDCMVTSVPIHLNTVDINFSRYFTLAMKK
jgi:hypothetical protein